MVAGSLEEESLSLGDLALKSSTYQNQEPLGSVMLPPPHNIHPETMPLASRNKRKGCLRRKQVVSGSYPNRISSLIYTRVKALVD